MIDRLPGLAAVVSTEGTRRRDGYEDPLGIARVLEDGVQTHPPRARLPGGPRGVQAHPRELVPGPATVHRAEQGGVLHSGVDGVRVGQRGFEMPYPSELPGMLRSVVPLLSARDPVVREFVSDRLPGRATVLGALNGLPEPAPRLGRIQPIRINRRGLAVIDLAPRT